MNNSLEKLKNLKENNKNPFSISKFDVNSDVKSIFDQFVSFEKLELERKNISVKIAGRIMRIRNFGNLFFAVLRSFDGDIQLISIKNKDFNDLEIGDIIGVDGVICKTDKGELSVKVFDFQLLSKCLKSIPDFHYGFNDVEERFRNRHLDFIVNKKNRDILINRAKVISFIRNYLNQIGFTEMETPILVSEASGAQAKPFITHHNKLSRDLNLRIATEIPLKTLLIGGFEKIYELGRIFRNEGIDARHNPEFTTIEIYESYKDSEHMMRLTENLINSAKNFLFSDKEKLNFNGHEVEIKDFFEKMTMIESIKKFSGVDFTNVIEFEEAKKLALEHKVSLDGYQNSVGHIITLFFEKFVEEKLIQPTFIYEYPIETSPLAKTIKGKEKFADRFELFISGLEFANGYSELNDSEEQRIRFEAQTKEKNLGNEEIAGFDNEFVDALEYGMPPAGGLGIGIDRLVMLLNEVNNIREVIAFPQMKKRN
ncbi:MAG: Lysine--tRNA ligase [Mycoplasmataceae bacterium]|nr:MAG: Lysine--tRNA ligase [Mycoplasmataceae bacterium]